MPRKTVLVQKSAFNPTLPRRGDVQHNTIVVKVKAINAMECEMQYRTLSRKKWLQQLQAWYYRTF